MGEGDINTALLWDWFNKSEQFFHHKNIDPDAHVETVTWGMTGVHVIHWLLANSSSLSLMGWDNYKTHMWALFLPTDWEHTTRMDVLCIQQHNKSFVKFSFKLMAKNNLLTEMDNFLNNDFLCDTLEANMDCELACKLNHKDANSIVAFRDWLNKEIKDTLAKLNIKSSFRAPTPTGRVFNSCALSSNPPFGTFVPILKLLDEERTLLAANGSCFKCRKFFAGHIRAHCMAPPIDGAKYKTLTARDIPPHLAGFVSRSTVAAVSVLPPVVPIGQVAAVLSEVRDGDGPDTVSDLGSGSPLPSVSAVLPNVLSWVDSGNWTDDDKATHQALFSSPEFTECLKLRCHLGFGWAMQSNTIITAIHGRLEDMSTLVSFQKQLKCMDAEMKKKFGNLSDDLPSVHRLPDQIYQKFILKDANKVVLRCGYTVPVLVRNMMLEKNTVGQISGVR
ncbi:hypothetical protein BDN71DRAFT_1501935 [Pleurotus eryngii]|uniref:Uncharacterized protein n=1 Tax=Pleurotus eryngii TaxID=5323 RepID=A0A9P6A843_PLEER|nr:hypothetical protein BDN71DRAFT_1501935 [Pleurotus eryngii]